MGTVEQKYEAVSVALEVKPVFWDLQRNILQVEIWNTFTCLHNHPSVSVPVQT